MATRRTKWDLEFTFNGRQLDEGGRKIDEVRRKAEKLDQTRIEPEVDINDQDASRALKELREELAKFDKTTAKAKADVDSEIAKLKIDKIQQQLKELDKFTADPNIDVDGVLEAHEQLSLLQKQLNKLDRTDARPSVRISGVSEMQKDASLLLDTIVALGPAGVVAGTAAGAGLVALSGSITTLGTGVGVLLGGLSGLGDAIKALNKIRLAKEAGIDIPESDLQAVQRAFAALSDEGQDFAKFVANQLIPGLEDLRSVAQEGILPGVMDGLQDAKTLVPQVTNIVESYADSWGDLAREAGDALDSPFWRDYFNFIGDKGDDSMRRIARSAGNFAEGLFAIQKAFFPLQRDMETGILGWSRAFNKWAQSLEGSQDFEEFLAYIDRVGPKVVDLVGSVADALLQIGEAAAPVGEATLPVLKGLADLIGEIADSPLGTPLIALATGIAAVNRASRVWQITRESRVIRGLQLFSGGTGEATRKLSLFKRGLAGAAGAAGLGLLIGATQVQNDKLSTMMSVLGGAGIGAMIGTEIAPGVGTAIGGVVGALGGLVISLGNSGDAAQKAEPKIDSYIDTLDRLTGAATRASRAEAARQLAEMNISADLARIGIDPSEIVDAMLGLDKGKLSAELTDRKKFLEHQLADLADEAPIGVEAQQKYLEQVTRLRERLAGVNKILDIVGVSQRQLNEDQKKAAFIQQGIYGRKVTDRLSDYGMGLRRVSQDLGLNRTRTDTLTEALEDATTAFFDSTGKMRLNRQELKNVADQMGLNKQQTDRLIESYNKMADRTQENRDASDHYKNTLDRVGRSLDLTKQDTQELTAKLLAQEDANVRLKGKADLTEKQLRDVAHQMGLTKQETQELINKYNDVPKDIRTDAHFNDDKARHDVDDFVRWTTQKWRKLQTTSPGFFGPNTIHVPGGQARFGGPVNGPGGKTSDSVLMRLSRGEFVQQAAAVDREGLSAMRALNAGQATIVPRRGLAKGGNVDDALALDAQLPPESKTPLAKVLSNFSSLRAFVNSIGAYGGRVGAAIKWARNQVGDDYRLGAVGPDAWDCSGFMSGVANFLRGNPLHVRLGATSNFPWPGFARGVDRTGFTIGSTPSYPGSGFGHMAGTLGGVNVESRGGEGVVVGPRARGYNDPGFTEVYHMTGLMGGRGPGSDTGALSNAEQWIINKESGGSVFANNPTSSAFGLGQLLEANRIHYARKLGYNWGIERGDTGSTDRTRQVDMFRAYVKDRYGNAKHAKAFWQSHGWYDQGGPFPSGTMGINTSGATEEVLTNRERAAFMALGRYAHMAVVHARSGSGDGGFSFPDKMTFVGQITNWEQGKVFFRAVANDNYTKRGQHAARMARMG